MIKKTITYLLLISLIYIINLKTVNASFSIPIPPSTAESTNETGKEEWTKPDPYPGLTTERERTEYQCSYKIKKSGSGNIQTDAYNIDNESIIENSLTISDGNKVIAGTSMGISLIETRTISWSTEIKVEKITYKKTITPMYYCYYKSRTPSSPLPRPGGPIQSIYSIFTFSKIQAIAVRCTDQILGPREYCPQTNGICIYDYKISTTPKEEESIDTIDCTESGCGRYVNKCQTEATQAAKMLVASASTTPSIKLELPDSNNVNGSNRIEIKDVTCTTITGAPCSTSAIGGTKSGTYTVKLNYKKPKACINVKSSEVSYKSGNCNEDEITINNDTIGDEEHWHYFIPLNAKSDKSIDINVMPAGKAGELEPDQCIQIMNNPNYSLDKETSYTDLIIKKDGEDFEGVPRIDEQEMDKNGCQITAKIKIYPKQEFYNEDEDAKGEKIFKGFNFYYKPINIETPFPNGLTKGSLWKEWNDKYTNGGNENPRIIESFDKLTYKTKGINLTKIREYNKDNAYTNWSNMLTNGESNFIKNEEIISRNTSTTFYKLGCGPKNADWSECR